LKPASYPQSLFRCILMLGTLLLAARLTYAEEVLLLAEPWPNPSPTAAPLLPPTTPTDTLDFPYMLALPITLGTPANERYAATSRAYELELLRLITDERAKRSLPALAENDALTQAARRHAADMAAHAIRGHIGTDGTDPAQRMIQEGYIGVAWGEASGLGGSTPQAIFDAWMQSQAHQGIMFDPLAQDIGVGYAFNGSGTYRTAWVSDTGR
jgi:uncharacterized protein YkwD